MLNAWNPQVERGFTAATPGDRPALAALVRDLDWISDHLLEEIAQLQELVQTGLDVSAP